MAARQARQRAGGGARRRDALSAAVRQRGRRLHAGRRSARRAAGADGEPAARIAIARFFAENIAVQASGLERAVIDGADSVNAERRAR